MIRRYKVTTMDFNRRPEFRDPDVKTVIAYDAKDAYNQVDLLIDKTIQCNDIKVTAVEPFPFTFIEKIKLLFRQTYQQK